MAEQKAPLSNKMLILAILGLVTAIGGGALVMLYLGAFSDAKVYRTVSPEYRIAYIEKKGSYANIEPVLNEVAEALKKAEMTPGTPCALYLDSVSEVNEEDRRSKIGYIVERNDYIPAPMEEMVVSSREVVAATFDGGTMLGSHKAYKAMREWSRANGYTLSLPALEIYHSNGQVEYQLEIHKK